MPKKHCVALSKSQRQELTDIIARGSSSSRRLTRVRILLKADQNGDAWTDEQISDALDVAVATVEKTRRRFAEGGVNGAIERRPQPARPQKRKIDGAAEAKLTMLACSAPPDGQARWTLNLLAERMVELKFVDAVSYETVRKVLKKAISSRG